MRWKLDHHLNRIRKEIAALESFQITDCVTLGSFGLRLQRLSKEVTAATDLIDRGKANGEQIQVFREMLPRLAGLSQKAFRSSTEVTQAFLGGPGR